MHISVAERTRAKSIVRAARHTVMLIAWATAVIVRGVDSLKGADNDVLHSDTHAGIKCKA
jgi:hypothetical protein